MESIPQTVRRKNMINYKYVTRRETDVQRLHVSMGAVVYNAHPETD
jgi:hypothetical protein